MIRSCELLYLNTISQGEWDDFVAAIDAKLGSQGQKPPALLSEAPCELEFHEAATGRRCQLGDWAGVRLLVLLRHFA